jgi:branched-chain amino acid transport system substrate-binding protein
MAHTRIIAALAAAASIAAGVASAQQTIKIGAVQSMTGPFNQNGRETMAGARLYLQEHGDTIAGKKIEIVLKDDASVPDVGKRLAQELIVNDKVVLLLGGITPSALSIAPLTVEAKIPMIVMVSGASITVERSPYIVRTSFTLGQSSSVIADWAVKNGARKVVTLVNDWAPGIEAEKTFSDVAVKGGARDRRVAAAAAGESRFCPLRAARPRSQAGHAVRAGSEHSGTAGQAVPGTRHGQIRHPIGRHW